jgi:hypothetical protein
VAAERERHRAHPRSQPTPSPRALNLLTMENNKLRSQISRISSSATPARLTPANAN